MNKTRIEWTESTWNPITGCTQISTGCLNCYAKKMANRLSAMKNPRYLNNFKLTIHKDLFMQPLNIKDGKVIFVCSMSDLFHEEVDFETISEIFDVMKKADWHIFQVLTKRSRRLKEFSEIYEIPENIWIGVTVEHESLAHRIDDLRDIKAKVKFLSCEPLLGSLNNCDFHGIDWIVVGGESGANARPLKEEWVLEIRDKCAQMNIKFFFKQWGGWNKKKSGKLLEGKIYCEMPNLDYII
jgi:protein gp37